MHETDHNQHGKVNYGWTTAEVSDWFLGSIQVEVNQNSNAEALKIDTEPQKWAWTPLNLNSWPYKIEHLNRNKILILLKMSRIQYKITHHINLSKRYAEDPNKF